MKSIKIGKLLIFRSRYIKKHLIQEKHMYGTNWWTEAYQLYRSRIFGLCFQRIEMPFEDKKIFEND
jgi:hypothetical protein